MARLELANLIVELQFQDVDVLIGLFLIDVFLTDCLKESLTKMIKFDSLGFVVFRSVKFLFKK